MASAISGGGLLSQRANRSPTSSSSSSSSSHHHLRHAPAPAVFVVGSKQRSSMACNSAPIRCDVAVVGGGLGGLAFASALQQRGFDAHVFEAAPELRTAHGTVIGVSNNGSYALETCVPGCLPLIMEAGVERSGFSIATKTRKDEELQRLNFPIPAGLGKHKSFGVRWGEVQRVLSSFVAPELVHCSHRVTGYTEEAGEGRVRLHFKGQPDVEARLAVAADGVRSALRATMIPNDPGPRYLGQINYGALLPNPGNQVVPFTKGAVQRDVYQPPGAEQWELQVILADSGGDHTYWNVGVERTEPDFLPDAQGVRPPKGFLGVRAGHPGSKEHAKKLLRDVGFDHILPFVEATPQAILYERAIVDRIPLDELGVPMYSKGGRVVLLGDAAHAMHPGPGVGAQMAFEDACVLATLLDQHRNQLTGWKGGASARAAAATMEGADGAGLLAVLAAYNDARMERVCRVQRFTVEGCGIASLRQRVRPEGVAPEEMQARQTEFFKWLTQFPNNAFGDPESKYWKPAPSSSKPEAAATDASHVRELSPV